MSGTRSEKTSAAPVTPAPAASVYASRQDKPKRKDSALKTSATPEGAVSVSLDEDVVEFDATEDKGEKKRRRHRKEKTTTEAEDAAPPPAAESHKEPRSHRSKSSKKKPADAVVAEADATSHVAATTDSAATNATASTALPASPTIDPAPPAAPATPPISHTPPRNVALDLAAAADAYNKAQAAQAALEQQTAIAKRTRDDYESIKKQLEDDREKATKRLLDAENRVKELEQLLKVAQEDFEAHKEDTKVTVEQKDQLIRSHKVQIDELENDLRKVREIYDTAKTQISQLEEQLEIANDRLPLLERQLADAEKAKDEAELALQELREEHQTQLEISARESEEASEDNIVPEKPRPRTRTEKAKAFGRIALSAIGYLLVGVAIACAIAFGLMAWQVTIPVVGVFLAHAIGPALTAVVYAAVLAPIAAGLALGVKTFIDWAFSSKPASAADAEVKSKNDDVKAYLEVDEAQELSSSAKLQAAMSASNPKKTTDTRSTYVLEVVEDKPKSVGKRIWAFMGKKDKPKSDVPTIPQDKVVSPYSSPAAVAH